MNKKLIFFTFFCLILISIIALNFNYASSQENFKFITGKAVNEGASCKIPKDDKETYQRYASSLIKSMQDSGSAITFGSIDDLLTDLSKNADKYGQWNIKKLRGALYSQMKMDLFQLIKWMSQNLANNGPVVFIKEPRVTNDIEEGSIYLTQYKYKFYPGPVTGLTIYDNKGNGLFSVVLTNENFWSYYEDIKDNPNWGPEVDKWDAEYNLPEDREYSAVYLTGWPVENGKGKYMGMYLNEKRMALIAESFRKGHSDKLKSLISGTWSKFTNWLSGLGSDEKGALAESITKSYRFIKG